MNFSAVSSLINFLGFALGIALYSVLLVMVVRHPIRIFPNEENGKLKFTINRMLFATAILGLLWNFGNLAGLAWRDYWSGDASPFLTGAAYAALGFLPAVIVHSEWLAATGTEKDFKTKLLTVAAYVLSGIAAILHFRAAVASNFAPSVFALQILTVGYLAILASLFLTTRGQSDGLKSVRTAANEVKEKLARALTAKTAFFRENYQKTDAPAGHDSPVSVAANGAEVIIPTADEPHFELVLHDLAGGRRLLSDEIEMLETVSLHTARRIDALRVTHERCERELREQEFSKLATEAELRALRAQINPHFLFNALTTIGYLIQTAPDRAVQTLMQLTGLLRGSLRSTGEFQTLGDELKLIRAYLEIEMARFEEHLQVEIDVPDAFLSFRIPSLILQPLVENAVKHGISPQKEGGVVRIEARRENGFFILQVADTGIGADELRLKRESRVGLNNVEQRLHLYYNSAASLTIEEGTGGGTIVEIRFATNAPQSPHQLYLTKAVNKSTEQAFL